MLEVPLDDALRSGADLEVDTFAGVTVTPLRFLKVPGLFPRHALQDLGLWAGGDATSASSLLHLVCHSILLI